MLSFIAADKTLLTHEVLATAENRLRGDRYPGYVVSMKLVSDVASNNENLNMLVTISMG